MTRVALCFPGQGSQAAGMAEGLLDAPGAADLLAAAAAEGLDLEAALGGDDEALRPTEVAQPALLFCGVVLARLVEGDGLEVVATAGHSVGEYAALVAAGALDPRDAMRLVVARGRAMAAMRQGGMTALLGTDVDTAERLCADVRAEGAGVVVVANLNAPGQVVLSGDLAALERAAALGRDRGVRRAVPLNVSGAFHSPLMAEAAERFAAVLGSASMRDARVPVVCNSDAAAVTDAAALLERLRLQLVSPVRWAETVPRLLELGAECLVELGPGGVLTGLARRIAPQVRAAAASTRDDVLALPVRVGAGADD